MKAPYQLTELLCVTYTFILNRIPKDRLLLRRAILRRYRFLYVHDKVLSDRCNVSRKMNRIYV